MIQARQRVIQIEAKTPLEAKMILLQAHHDKAGFFGKGN